VDRLARLSHHYVLPAPVVEEGEEPQEPPLVIAFFFVTFKPRVE